MEGGARGRKVGVQEGRSERNKRVEKWESKGKCLTGERGSWRTMTEAMFTLQLKVSYF